MQNEGAFLLHENILVSPASFQQVLANSCYVPGSALSTGLQSQVNQSLTSWSSQMGQLAATESCDGCCLGGKNHRSVVSQKEAKDCLVCWEGFVE